MIDSEKPKRTGRLCKVLSRVDSLFDIFYNSFGLNGFFSHTLWCGRKKTRAGRSLRRLLQQFRKEMIVVFIRVLGMRR